MSYSLNDQRKQTMLKRIGEASELIDDQRFLPFYRGVQIRLEKMGKSEEWARMIATAKSKSSPSHYFARLCKMVRDGSYKFVEAIQEVVAGANQWLNDRIVKFKFGKYQKYWYKKAEEYINLNSESAFVDLYEYCQRTGRSQQYFAKALKNCKSPRAYFEENVIGGAK